MQMEKCRWKNANDSIGTRRNKFTMFSYILSCKVRPREFTESEIKKK